MKGSNFEIKKIKDHYLEDDGKTTYKSPLS